MMKFLKRVAYWTSVGFDNSEGPAAYSKQSDREKYYGYEGGDKEAVTDLAFYVSMLVPLTLVSIPAFLIFLLIR